MTQHSTPVHRSADEATPRPHLDDERPSWATGAATVDTDVTQWVGPAEKVTVTDTTTATPASIVVRVRLEQWQYSDGEDSPVCVSIQPLTHRPVHGYLPKDGRRVAEAILRATEPLGDGG